METFKKVVKVSFGSLSEERRIKFEAFAKETVKQNADVLGTLLEDRYLGETVSQIINGFVNEILSMRYAHLSKEAILNDLANGSYLELRSILLEAFENDPVIKFHINEDEQLQRVI